MSFDAFKFYVQTRKTLGENCTQIINDLSHVYPDSCPSQATIYRYFNDNENDENKEETRGRKRTSITPESIANVKSLIESDRHMSLRSIAQEIGISHESVRSILHDHLHRRYLCSTWVPHQLSVRQKELRVTSAKSIRHNLAQLGEAKHRLYCVQDETLVFFSALQRKSKNKAWVALGEKKPIVVKQQNTNKKTMLSVMFTTNKKISIMATSSKETINHEYFIKFLTSTGNKWRVLRRDPTKLSELVLQFDNARPHTAGAVKEFLEKRGVNTVWQAPYSPDLNMCDRWLFDRLKLELADDEYETHEEVEEAALRILRSIPQDEYEHQLEKLFSYCQAVIEAGGDYVL